MIRVYLAPIFIIAGYNKLGLADPDITGLMSLLANPNIVEWFGNSEWGLGLPFPALLANLAAWSEFLGGWFLLFGLLTRLVSIPLMFTMIIAMTTVHADNGWFAITPRIVSHGVEYASPIANKTKPSTILSASQSNTAPNFDAFSVSLATTPSIRSKKPLKNKSNAPVNGLCM